MINKGMNSIARFSTWGNLLFSFVMGVLLALLRTGTSRQVAFYFGYALFFLSVVCLLSLITSGVHFFINRSKNSDHNGLVDYDENIIKVAYVRFFYLHILISTLIVFIVLFYR